MTDCLAFLPRALAAVGCPNPSTWASVLEAPMRSSGLITTNRAAMFIGQCAEESGGFTVLVENLDYSAERLRAVWPYHFPPIPGEPSAEWYAHKPEAIANLVYANRMGNGPPSSGDGWKFRGCGIIQGTGRDYWTRFGKSVQMDPESAWNLAQTARGAAEAACWYWIDRGHLLALSDTWDVTSVTQRVNGGLLNLDRRVAACTSARDAFNGSVTDPDNSADDLMAQEQQQLDDGNQTS